MQLTSELGANNPQSYEKFYGAFSGCWQFMLKGFSEMDYASHCSKLFALFQTGENLLS